ncbi:MBL fold metallo-hydrolase [Streptococcus himalayensis]|uniref:Hydrolase n=1 Tax=Streptococcus himalayensis TaxID=1888195 RepID=A0A917A618_9STRE|nr:MBL fold metallo-hydrolase [Streptococcus himalayensis]GGE25397.1 hydrolase [Streptococcus himalayensis]
MKIHTTLNTQAYQNTYYLENETHLLIIDPGSDWEVIRSKIEEINKPISAILLTHAHYDHIMSLDLVRKQFGAPPVYISEKEGDWLYTPTYNRSGLPMHDDIPDVILQPAEHFFAIQTPYHLDGFHFYVLETPGHSIGSVSLVFPDDRMVLSGDALFFEAIGRFDLYTGDKDTLLTSIKTQLFTLPNYDVYPGHGPATTISHEKLFNPFF